MNTKHNLIFESRPCIAPIDDSYEWQEFRIGTCTGMWTAKGKSFVILAIKNSSPGNGHLDDVFQWFEFSCKRDNYSLEIWEVWNQKFKKHLLDKRGFIMVGADNLIKRF